MGQDWAISGGKPLRLAFVVLGCFALANCASSGKFARKVDPKYGVTASPRVVEFGEPVPKGGGTYRVGKPYVVAGRTFVPNEGQGYRAEGMASWYGDDFHGRLTANGEVFDMESITAAHPTLPMPSYVRVTNLSNKKSLVVRVNDRGPFHGDRVIDLSVKSAQLLGFHGHGLARVRVEFVGTAPLEGSDDRMLAATLREDGPAPAPSRVMVASAKPFIPQFDEKPAVRVAGPVPVPSERPFTLGAPDTTASPRLAAANSAPEITSVNRIEAPAAGSPRLAWTRGPDAVVQAPAPEQPAVAYAPVRQAPAMGFSARGLY